MKGVSLILACDDFFSSFFRFGFNVQYSVQHGICYRVVLQKTKSGEPATLTSGCSLLYSTMYTVQYIVHCSVQYSIGVWSVHVLSGM